MTTESPGRSRSARPTVRNGSLAENPEAINAAPYAQWTFKLQPAAPFDAAGFLDAAGLPNWRGDAGHM